VKLVLLDPRAAPLDQNNQNDDNQYTSSNPDDHGAVHSNSSFLLQLACAFLTATRVCAPLLEQITRDTRRHSGETSGSQNHEPASKVRLHGADGTKTRSVLLDPRAAPLDQNNQNDDNQYTGSNPNDHGTVHIYSSFPQ
jgi:hypothetical protein